MTVKSRRKKIEKAEVSIVNVSKKTGFKAIVNSDYTVRSLSAQRKGQGYVYEVSCHNGQPCKGNSQRHTACYHVLAAMQEVYRLSGYIFRKTDSRDDSVRLLNLNEKATLIEVLSEGDGSVFCTVQPNPNASMKDALGNLKQLIEEKRIALKPGGAMLIAKGVQLFRRGDDKLEFRLLGTAEFSGPIAFWGQDRSGQEEYKGIWKLTDNAEKNWQEFIRKGQAYA